MEMGDRIKIKMCRDFFASLLASLILSSNRFFNHWFKHCFVRLCAVRWQRLRQSGVGAICQQAVVGSKACC